MAWHWRVLALAACVAVGIWLDGLKEARIRADERARMRRWP